MKANLSNQSFACIKTHGGRFVFVMAHKNDDETTGLATLARFLEGIELNPDPAADLREHGISEWSIGELAIEEIQKQLRDLTC